MEAKEFLKTVYWSEKEVNSLRNELRQVEATLLSSPSWSDMKVQTSGMQSTDDTYVQMMEIRERLMHQISHTVMMRDKASQMISRVPDEKQRFVLRERYLNRRDWVEISDDLLRSRSQIYRIHGFGLLAFKEIFNKEAIG